MSLANATTVPLLDTVKNNKYLLIKFSGDEVGNRNSGINLRERSRDYDQHNNAAS